MNYWGCDVSTPEGVRYARENGLFKDFCTKMVASAVDILESVIERERIGIIEDADNITHN